MKAIGRTQWRCRPPQALSGGRLPNVPKKLPGHLRRKISTPNAIQRDLRERGVNRELMAAGRRRSRTATKFFAKSQVP
jgi:hypothetical protein